MSTLKAAWVPGLPHILRPESSSHWLKCATAMENLGRAVQAESFERIVLYSTQWLSVLGTSFQCQANPKGTHVDENWYEWGDLPFDFRCDAVLGQKFMQTLKAKGFPGMTVDFEGFPIDTGTLVALRFLNPEGKIPVSLVSSWVYANAEASQRIGSLMREVIEASGQRTLVVASSLLSTHFTTREIDPEADAIASPADDDWNRKVLALWEQGNLEEVATLAGRYTEAAKADMQFNAFHWLRGILGDQPVKGKVSHYGPLWGTGAAVVEFHHRG